ncbi:O-antigen ligase family protein [Pseudarthrobacter sp. 1G09]|uniref:O-antigen ligase family protein n=1 Tax=Pseudarthrobacter sp. 1G09 TaxID=3416178 RepID=UPI003CF72768
MLALSITAGSSLYGLSGAPGALTSCRNDKCGFTGVLFSGVLGHENSLGLVLILLIPLLFALRDRLVRLLAGAAVGILVLASGSRTSLIALLAVGSVWLLLAIRSRHRTSTLRVAIRRLALLAPVAGFAVATFLVVSSRDNPGAFTGRSQLWNLAVSAIAEDPLFGRGLYGWADIRQSTGAFGASAGYSPHNQFLDVALQGGVFAAAGLVGLTLLWIKQGWDGFLPSTLYVTALAWAGISERPVSFGLPDWSSVGLIAGILLLAANWRCVDTETGNSTMGFLDAAGRSVGTISGSNAKQTPPAIRSQLHLRK